MAIRRTRKQRTKLPSPSHKRRQPQGKSAKPKSEHSPMKGIKPHVIRAHEVLNSLERVKTSDYPRLLLEVQRAIESVLGITFQEAASVLAPFLAPDFLPRDDRTFLCKPLEYASQTLIPGPLQWFIVLTFQNLKDTHGDQALDRELSLLRRRLTGDRLGRRRSTPVEDLVLIWIRHKESLTDRQISERFNGRYTPEQVRELRRQHFSRGKP
jgi:hypothetical protein